MPQIRHCWQMQDGRIRVRKAISIINIRAKNASAVRFAAHIMWLASCKSSYDDDNDDDE